MIRINLLPWREALRERRRRLFYVHLGLAGAAGILVGVMGSLYLDGLIERQQGRNRFLSEQIGQLDKQLAELKDLRALIDGIIARKNVIESLRARRVEPVLLVDELPRRLPEATFLESLERRDALVTLRGISQSNARVSETMRSLESSPYLTDVRLIETVGLDRNNQRVVRFGLQLRMDRKTIETMGAPDAGEGKP
ncbi:MULTISPECIES: PilN domain-containing protein [Tepidiphilus]|uniref:Fimbrial protein n=1 Tax=Tepidiphilus baoligensis TaxID=2698687 RepID=A0ABX1QPS0_9PROT|nr:MULTISPECIES: PilN domain-containing protein [Tepidiphilus]NMH17124.1 fimbrial protein [Tepidiphilus baoligensis]